MTLIELTEEIQSVSSDKVVQSFAKLLKNWIDNNRTIDELDYDVEKYIGTTWIQKEEDHSKIYNLWVEFREIKISNIDTMTMNERLYNFGLINRFDSCTGREEREIIYKKINAKL